MSTFRVQLNNIEQGLLDKDPSTATGSAHLGGIAGEGLGDQMSPSNQRTVYVMGPNRTNRLLKDGDTFTDCNYWKKFAYPQVPYEQAFIYVVLDDGSVYSDIASENVVPYVFDLTLDAESTYTDAANIADMVAVGGYAVFAQITNKNTSTDPSVKMKINDSVIIDLPADTTQVFNVGDLTISKLAFDNSESGAVETAVQILVSLRSVCNS
jgi:hypothetical protein